VAPGVRGRGFLVTALVAVLVLGGLAAAALLEWPQASLGKDDQALARVSLPGYAGHVTAVDVRAADGGHVPVRVRDGKVWPLRPLDSGERLRVRLTVERPGWAGWLVGHSKRSTFRVVTPSAQLSGRWLQVKPGTPVMVRFDHPVSLVSVGGAPAQRFAHPRRVVDVNVLARGAHAAGAIQIAAAARTWEKLPASEKVSWFPAQSFPQLLSAPAPGVRLRPDRGLTLTFSSPVSEVFGDERPSLVRATPGSWRLVDAHTLAFEPRGLGFGLGTKVSVTLPRAVHVVGQAGTALTRTLEWEVPGGSTLRLQQLLAQLGYLPVDWQPSGTEPSTERTQLSAAVDPPAGEFSWRYANTPDELVRQWHAGEWNEITRGAVMMFQQEHELEVDAIAGPDVWGHVIADALAGKRRDEGYSYVFVHRSVPQSLNLWHNGSVILSSPGNTGVPAAPTQLGTFPVFEHIPIGTMSGTNPDGSHYNDPGIRWISYFNHGDAIHSFTRSSFGTPQSLGCVELPLAAAAKVWPYTPIGTLVTVED
jgi:hypothetical protein